MSERETFILGKLEEIMNEENNTLEAGRREELRRDRVSFEAELEQIKAAKQAQEEQEQAAQLRIQAHEEKLESIVLPYDFNDIFSDDSYKNEQGLPHTITSANAMIIELIKDYKRQDNAEHNAEIEALITGHRELVASLREELRAAADRELQLKRQNDELQVKFAEQEIKNSAERDEDSVKINKLEFELKHANSQRDAAVVQAEGLEMLVSEKDAHIQTLRDEAAIGASRTVNITAIEASDKLEQIVAVTKAAKAAKIKSAVQIALETQEPVRGIIIPGTLSVATNNSLEVPQFLEIDEVAQNAVVEQFRKDFEAGLAEGNASGRVAEQENMGATKVETVSREEFEELKKAVDTLYVKQRALEDQLVA